MEETCALPSTGEAYRPVPLTNPDTLFEGLLQDLPPETAQMAREFKAFVRAKKVQTPKQLLRVVFLYCGLDKSCVRWRGPFRRCMRPSRTNRWRSAYAPVGRGCKRCSDGCCRCLRWTRCLRGDAVWSLTPVVFKPQEPLAPTIASISRWTCCPCSFSRCWSAMPARRNAQHCSLAPGDVAVADRGYAQCQGMRAAVQQGAESSYDFIPSVWSCVTRRERLGAVRHLETTENGNDPHPGGGTPRDRWPT